MLKPKFSSASFKKDLLLRVERINEAVLNRLIYVGETFVNNARNKNRSDGGFGDVTGNLRSSIGYAVLFNGKLVKGSDFNPVSSGAKGSQNGKAYLKSLYKNYKDAGFVLIVVAGMDYAAALESKGKDVITGSSLIAEEELKTALANIKNKIKN